MSKRTDPHSPSNIKTEDYRFLAFYVHDSGCPEATAHIMAEHRRMVQQHLETHGKGFARNPSAGACYCCGSFHNAGITCVYLPTMELVQFGHTCGGHIEGMNDAAFRRFSKTADEIRERVAGYAKAELLLGDYGLPAEVMPWFRSLDIALRDGECDAYGERIEPEALRDLQKKDKWTHEQAMSLIDMMRKLVKYGSWSEGQQRYALKIWNWIETVDERVREHDAKKAAEGLVDVEAGRREIVGEVVTVRWQESMYGSVCKLLIACDGFKVWTTEPSNIHAEKGQRVKMNVTLQPKERGFAIGKRPAKAEII